MKKTLAESDKIAGTRFTWHQALRQGIGGPETIPTEEQRENIIRQAKALEPIALLLGGITVTSWLRTKEHNAKIGGALNSVHLTGLATDFVPQKCSPEEARQLIKKAGVYPGRTELDSPTWCHYDLSSNRDFYGRPKKTNS